MNPLGCFLVFFCLGLNTAFAATQSNSKVQADRVVARPDLRATAALAGHVPAWAVSANDRGAIAPDSELRLTFLLSRSPEMQASFTQLLRDQQDPASPRYHQWLTPQQVGEQYGPTQHDVDALTSWLGSQGLKVVETSPSRIFVHVAAPASTVGSALATSFHTFSVGGKARISATADPSIPAAFASIVSSIAGLADADIRPMVHGQAMAMTAPVQQNPVQPLFTNGANHYITPGDFATIFDLKPVYSAGYTGTGQKVAVIGRSRVASSDITEFESNTGLTNNVPNVVIPTTGTDPGLTNDDDQAEATLDVERVLGTAPGVQADLVVSSRSAGGVYNAASYEVETLLDPVMNISFGACEAYQGASGVSLWDTLFAQAASEGISVFVSAGDTGAAGCDDNFGTPPAYQFLSINYLCASSYATCVGGTEFADTANPTQYWATTNGAGLATALGYIPEGAWNEINVGVSSTSYIVASGGGGASIYVPKPAWQIGTGVPADNARDVPDVSFPASFHDAYYGCFAAGGGDCGANHFYYYFGTSAGTPSMAAVTALLNQKTGGSQGNLNPLLYRLASSSPAAYHDAAPANIPGIVCVINTPGICNNSTPGASQLTGGLAGYALTPGYDQATGLGSLDVANFLTAAAAVTNPNLAPTTLQFQGNATTLSNTQTTTLSAAVTSSTAGTPTGTVQFYANGRALGAPVAVSSGMAVMSAVSFPAAGGYFISATYSGDSVYAPSTAAGYQLTVTGLASTTSVKISSAAIPVGTTATFTATVTGGSGSVVPTGTVRFYAPGSTNDEFAAVVPLSNGTATSPPITFPYIGSYSLTAMYVGDSVYSKSNSTTAAFSVQKLVSNLQLISDSGNNPAPIGTGGGEHYLVVVGPAINGSRAPGSTGTVQLYANGVALGSPIILQPNANPQGSQNSSMVTFPAAGTYAITAAYSGDATFQPANATGPSVTVLSTPAYYQLSVASPTLSITAGAVTKNEDDIVLSSMLGFTGLVNVSCSVVYNDTGVTGTAPSCILGSNAPTISPTLQTPISLKIGTTARGNSKVARLSDGGSSRHNWLPGRGGAAVCGLLFCCLPFRRRRWRMVVMLLVFAAGFNALTGCSSGGSSSSTPPPPAGTTAGHYTVTITASSPGSAAPAPAPVTIALTVN